MAGAKKSKQNILFVNRFFYPDYSATSQILSDLAFNLVELQRDVSVITSRLKYDSPNTDLEPFELINGVKVYRVWTTQFGRRYNAGRLFDYLTFYLSAAIMLWKLTKKDFVVVVKTDPPLISVVAAIIVRLKGARLINWLQDVFPEVARALNIRFINGLFFNILRFLRNYSLKGADVNIVLGKVMAEYISSQGIPGERIRILSNWADGSSIQPLEHKNNALRIEWGLQGKFVFGYSGNLGRAHQFENIIKAAEAFKMRDDVVFLFIGDGAQKDAIEKVATENGISSIIFKPYQQRDNLIASLGCIDVHLISLNPTLEGYIVPSKVYGVFAAGRPSIFIGDKKGEIAQLLTRYKCGVSVESNDSKALYKAMQFYINNKAVHRKHGERARSACVGYFDKRVCVGAFESIL